MVRVKSTPERHAFSTPVKSIKNSPGQYAPRKARDYIRKNLVINRGVFQGIVKEVALKIAAEKKVEIHYTPVALHATQNALEEFLTDLLVEAAYIANIRRKHVGQEQQIIKGDINVARRMIMKGF
jgi:histone H3/H4